jgi:hypothetical protein
VALKMLRAGARATVDDRRRLLEEAKVAAWLDHPHISAWRRSRSGDTAPPLPWPTTWAGILTAS